MNYRITYTYGLDWEASLYYVQKLENDTWRNLEGFEQYRDALNYFYKTLGAKYPEERYDF